MKKKITPFVIIALIGIFVWSISSAFKSADQKKPWPVPDNYQKMKNPVASNSESLATGKALWSTHCKSCHGSKGLGDGSKAAQLKTEPGDFSTTEFQSEPDGSHFYRMTEGRDDMPSFKKKIPDPDDRWSVVVYMKTFKK
jgi:mono/diheme cytochrome c family protein